MHIHDDVIAAIGNTPLIKLRRASELTGCTILGRGTRSSDSLLRS
ncbi:hypothetical protein [Archangium minus]